MKKATLAWIRNVRIAVSVSFHGALSADAEEESYGEQGADDYVFKFYVLHKYIEP